MSEKSECPGCIYSYDQNVFFFLLIFSLWKKIELIFFFEANENGEKWTMENFGF